MFIIKFAELYFLFKLKNGENLLISGGKQILKYFNDVSFVFSEKTKEKILNKLQEYKEVYGEFNLLNVKDEDLKKVIIEIYSV